MRTRGQRFPTWALWISSAITFLAASILIIAIVLGVRAGQQQLEIKRRQQLSLILEQAFEFHNQGRVEAARIAYEEALLIDPNNISAAEGLGQLRGMRPGDVPLAIATREQSAPITDTAQPQATMTSAINAPITPAATATKTTAAADIAAMAQANEAFAAGRWTETIEKLEALRRANPTYEEEAVNALLFDAYVNLATEKDNQNKYQEALTLFEQALALDPSATDIRAERDLIEYYIDAITYAEADWDRAIVALEAIYREEPSYRDVKSRLQQALRAQSEAMADAEEWCDAADTLSALIAIGITPGVVAQRDVYEEACNNGDELALATTRTPVKTEIATTDSESTPSDDGEATTTAAPTRPTVTIPTGAPNSGTILYSAYDATSGRSRILAQDVGSTAAPALLREDAGQPALRQDGGRLLYRNLRNDMAGISAWDPGSGLLLRFTQYAEDSLPSWSGQGNQFVFASNREGDRIWRIYVSWAESDSDGTTLSIGEAPAWHPTTDMIVFRGCDNTGNRCGLWQINSSGGARAPLTTVPTDNRPAWSPNGRYVVFMSDSRAGNFEIYRVDVNSGQILALTEHSNVDVLPTVSPNGSWVAFLSNRDGSWKIWAVPLSGGAATAIAPISGNIGSWTEQALQWVP